MIRTTITVPGEQLRY